MRTRLVALFIICCMLVTGSVCAAIGDAPTNNYASSTSVVVIPDGRIVSGEFIVGKPTEIERLFDSTTIAYDGGLMSTAVCDAEEAIKRYEASKIVAANKIGFTTPLLKTQMSYLYRIKAEALFSSNETAKAMGFMRTALALDPDSVTNQIVCTCLATDLEESTTIISARSRFSTGPSAVKVLFFREVIKRGWLLPFDLTNEEFLHFDEAFGLTNRLDRPTYYTDKMNGHKIVRRWRGLDQYRDCDFTELQEYVRATMKVKDLFNQMLFAHKSCVITGIVDLASSCLSEYSRLPNGYIKEHPSLTMIPTRCHLTLADAYMANKEYATAMSHVLSAEENDLSAYCDVLKTIILILDEKPVEASRLALIYKRSRADKKIRDAYFKLLIAAGYIFDMRCFSDEPYDIRKEYGLECAVTQPMFMQTVMDGKSNVMGNGDMVQQWTGLRTFRYEPVGPMRQQSWNAKTNHANSLSDTMFSLDTLEVSNPSSNGLDVVLVVTPYYERVFSYIWNDPQKEIGWYNFDTQERATNVFVRDENILWFGNPSAKLTRFTLRGAIELKEVASFPRSIKTHKVSSEPQKTVKWKQRRLGDDRFDVGWIKRELNLVPDATLAPPYRLSISNTVIAVSTNGRPSIAQLRYVDKKKREAKWYSPFSSKPSPILFGDIVSYSVNIPGPDWLDKVTQTTLTKGLGLCWQKILEFLGITREEFAEEPSVYYASAGLLVIIIMIVTGVWSRIRSFSGKHLGLVWKSFWSRIRVATTAMLIKLTATDKVVFSKIGSSSLFRRCWRWNRTLCIRFHRKLKMLLRRVRSCRRQGVGERRGPAA